MSFTKTSVQTRSRTHISIRHRGNGWRCRISGHVDLESSSKFTRRSSKHKILLCCGLRVVSSPSFSGKAATDVCLLVRFAGVGVVGDGGKSLVVVLLTGVGVDGENGVSN